MPQVLQVVSQASKAGFQVSKGVHHPVPLAPMVPIRAVVLSVIRTGYRDNLVSLASKAVSRVSRVVSRDSNSKVVSQVGKAGFRDSNRRYVFRSWATLGW